MKTSSFATAAALLSTSYAATVTLETTKCLDPTYPSAQPVEVEMNVSRPVAVDLPAVCGLRIVSASPSVDITTIKCQAFKDVAGTQPGSAIFTYASPALIATNPVSEQSIECTYSVSKPIVVRQLNETLSPTPGSTALSSSTGSAASLLSSSPASSAASTTVGSTVTSLVVVTPSAGMPSPSGNSTTSVLVTKPTPSQTSAPPSDTPGAAAELGVGMGVAFAAVLAMFV